jgi:hypothetical protein
MVDIAPLEDEAICMFFSPLFQLPFVELKGWSEVWNLPKMLSTMAVEGCRMRHKFAKMNLNEQSSIIH